MTNLLPGVNGPTIIIPKKNIIMDSQLLTSLMKCPRLTNFRFNDSLAPVGGKNNSLECGTLVHVIKEYYNKAIISGLSKEQAMEKGYEAGNRYIVGCPACISYSSSFSRGETIGERCKEHEHQDWIGLQDTPEENEKRASGKSERIGWKFVLATMREYFDYWSNDSWVTIGAEEVRGSIIYEDDTMRILWKAKFDQIDDTPLGQVSTDVKTMKMKRDTLSLNNQFMGQCLLLKARNIRIDKVGFQTTLPVNEKFQRILISYSADRLAEWSQEIVPYYANALLTFAEANVWPPNFDACEGKYGHCDFKGVCETDRGIRSEMLKIHFKKIPRWDIKADA